MQLEFEYLKLQEYSDPKQKTKRFYVLNRDGNVLLGSIYWYSAWRRYIFAPQGETIFDRKCLDTISGVITQLMAERKPAKEEDKSADWKPVVGRDFCQAGRDGDCFWAFCPQLRDNEPATSGRHCPIDTMPDYE